MQYEKNTGINTIYKPDDLKLDKFIEIRIVHNLLLHDNNV